MEVVETRMLNGIIGQTLKDSIRNLWKALDIAYIEDKVRKSCLRWLEHVQHGELANQWGR